MNLRFSSLRVLFMLLVLGISDLESLPSEKGTDVPIESPFKLTLRIDKESYSTVPDVIDGWKRPYRQLVLNLRLHFTNQTRKVVRLDKDCIHLSDVVVYEDSIVGPPELEISQAIVLQRLFIWSCPYAATDRFLAIPPAESYESKMNLQFEVLNWGPIYPPESLRPGKYFLKIAIGTWWEMGGDNQKGKQESQTLIPAICLTVTSERVGFVVDRKLPDLIMAVHQDSERMRL